MILEGGGEEFTTHQLTTATIHCGNAFRSCLKYTHVKIGIGQLSHIFILFILYTFKK